MLKIVRKFKKSTLRKFGCDTKFAQNSKQTLNKLRGMSTYFSISELTRSETALLSGIDNTPSPAVKARLDLLARRILDPVRELWGAPLIVNSGYRSPPLNRAVGGAASSQHIRGEAADITTGSAEGNRRLFEMIIASFLEFDQLIDEHNYSWLHLSYREGKNRRQILHIPKQ
jgi:hypothetical protein